MNPRSFPLQIIPILTILKTTKRLTMTSIHLVLCIIMTYRDFMGRCFSRHMWRILKSNCYSSLFHYQFSSVIQSCPTLCNPLDCSTSGLLSISSSWSLLKLMSIESVMPSNHLILCHPLLLLSSIFPSIRVFSNESVFCIRWPKYWSFNFSTSPSNEHPGLISFKMDWLDHFAVQGTLKSLLQHHNSKASILWRSAFFIVQLSHPYMTTEETIALTRQTFVMLSRLVITF